MFIAIGNFKLKEKKQLFQFLRLSKKIEQQALKAAGNVEVKLLGGSLTNFYVLSKWESVEAMQNFSRTGFHKEAIARSKDLSSEIRLIYFEGDQDLTKKEVKTMLHEDERVRVLKFN
ncbi:MAG: antibiotic biosynthesis monooxygenase [Crocinitomicaceae bacterium]